MSNYLKLEQIPGNPAELPLNDLASLADLYVRVFAGEPWNEWTVCPASGSFFDTSTTAGEPCQEPHCQATLEVAYPREQTMAYIQGELSGDASALWLLRDEAESDTIVGFTWGFAYENLAAFARAKYKTPEMQIAISGLFSALNIGHDGLWYLSESGIENDSRYRGKGISREFHTKRLDTARSLGLCAVQRTSAWGPMYRTSKRTMTQIMGVETTPDYTARLQPTGTIINAVDDTEIDGRVLFAKSGH